MDRLRLATWNIEWFNALFDDHGRLHDDDAPAARYGVSRAQQTAAIAIVLSALDADGVLVIEGPDTNGRHSSVRALEGFARRFGLRTRKALIGTPSETEQEIVFLHDPDRIAARPDPQGSLHPGPDDGPPRFDGVWRYDLDTDRAPETIRFSKPPLELDLRLPGREPPLRLIGVHAKSKAPHGATSRDEVVRLSIDNRRKQLAQCIWLRARVERHLAAGDDLVVLGDFNDGPGLDEFEKLFGQSGVEIVLGREGPAAMRLHDPHAAMALQAPLAAAPTTARFWHGPQKRWFEALLDFIMVSPGLAATGPAWRIWHPFDDPGAAAIPELREALLQASDHFPVTLDLPLPGVPAPPISLP
jgi:hypothetical protein